MFRSVAGEAASVNDEDVDAWLRKNIPAIASYSKSEVYNADETSLFYEMLPSKTHALKGESCSGGKHSKSRVTVLLRANMNGSDQQEPFIIGKSRKPRCFGNYVPMRYRHNNKAWMTQDLFAERLIEFDQDMARKKRNVLLVLDDCSAHRVQPPLTAVNVLFLPPQCHIKDAAFGRGHNQCFQSWLSMTCSAAHAGYNRTSSFEYRTSGQLAYGRRHDESCMDGADCIMHQKLFSQSWVLRCS